MRRRGMGNRTRRAISDGGRVRAAVRVHPRLRSPAKSRLTSEKIELLLKRWRGMNLRRPAPRGACNGARDRSSKSLSRKSPSPCSSLATRHSEGRARPRRMVDLPSARCSDSYRTFFDNLASLENQPEPGAARTFKCPAPHISDISARASIDVSANVRRSQARTQSTVWTQIPGQFTPTADLQTSGAGHFGH
jgi:hypothetical protein